MSFELDPQEVLMHLHELGYNNISQKQLEEFMRDLKRLINYDITKKKRNIVPQHVQQTTSPQDSTSSTLPNTTDESLCTSPAPCRRMQENHYCQGFSGKSAHSKDTEAASSSSSESSSVPARRVLRECTKLAAQRNHEKENVPKSKPGEGEAPKIPLKPSKSCDCTWRRLGCKCCEENWTKEKNSLKSAKSKENLAPSRPKSSFIRTWQMTGQTRPGSASQRSDPVALYQQYQQMWKQQKLPGENNHNDLRWAVRERLLGQPPHPRPLSQASSVTSIRRSQKRL